MPFSLDAEVAKGLDDLTSRIGEIAPAAVGDIATRRNVHQRLQREIYSQLPVPDDVVIEDFETTTTDGANILLRWYVKRGSSSGSAVLYAHGGGMILSNVEIYDGIVSRYVSATAVPFLSVEYRYAPEFPAPTPVTDCYAGLKWLAAKAPALGVDPRRIAIMGDSGGGGVAASLAIFARDHAGPDVAKQVLIYPMLDDRNTTPDPKLAEFAPWTYDDNATGWGALLGADVGGPDVSPYGAAARLTDFAGLPSAYIEVGELDIFRDETIAYAHNLFAAGVSTELHVHPGVPHAYETFVPDAAVSLRCAEDRHHALMSF